MCIAAAYAAMHQTSGAFVARIAVSLDETVQLLPPRFDPFENGDLVGSLLVMQRKKLNDLIGVGPHAAE